VIPLALAVAWLAVVPWAVIGAPATVPGADADLAACSQLGESAASVRACLRALDRRVAKLEIENPPSPEDDAAERRIAELETRVRQLQVRNADLDSRVKALQASRDGSAEISGGTGGTKVQAPFEVVGPDGKGVFMVTAEATRTMAGLRSPGRDGLVTLYSDATGVGLTLRDDSVGKATLEVKASPTLRIYHKDKQVAVFGSTPANGGAGGIMLSTPNHPRSSATLSATTKGYGYLWLSNGGGEQVLVATAEDASYGVFSAGKPVAMLRRSEHGGGGNVLTATNGGAVAFEAGAAKDGIGEACVWRKEGRNFCLGLGLPGMGIGK
jgi:hypothetical protein